MLQIPVYIATGFLESGKTSFIKEILEEKEIEINERFQEA